MVAAVLYLSEQSEGRPGPRAGGGKGLAEPEETLARVAIERKLLPRRLVIDDLPHLVGRQRLDADGLEQLHELRSAVHVEQLVGGGFADQPQAPVGQPWTNRIQQVLGALNGGATR